MSAVIVDHEHIHVLIWAASKPIAPPNPTMRWLYDNPTRVNQVEPDGSNRDEIGQILLDENADSVNHLYSDTAAAGDLPLPAPQHTEWSIAELLNALDAYTYQAVRTPRLGTQPGQGLLRRATRPAHLRTPRLPRRAVDHHAPQRPRQRQAARRPAALKPTHSERKTPTMSNHTEWGRRQRAPSTPCTRASGPPRNFAPMTPTRSPAHTSLGLWNQTGDGLALQGTRRELLTYLRLVIEHVERETDPRGELDQALRRLHTLRAERSTALEAGDHAAVTRLDEQEVSVLDDVAYAAEIVNDQL